MLRPELQEMVDMTIGNESIPWSLIGFVVSGLLAIWLYFKSNKKRKPFYLLKNFSLIEEKVDGIEQLQLSFDGQSVEQFSIAHVALWNGGAETINKSDVAPNDPIRIEAGEGVEILGAKIVFANNTANNFKVRMMRSKKRRANLYFDYFDRNEGAIIQVLHTGSQKDSITVKGSIKKAGAIRNANNGFSDRIFFGSERTSRLLSKYKRLIMGFVIFITPVVPVIEIFFPSITEPLKPKTALITSLVLIFVYWPIGFLVLKRRIPKELSIFDEM